MHLNRMPLELIVLLGLGLCPCWVLADRSEMTVQVMAKMESDALDQVYRQATQRAKPTRPAPRLLAIHGVLPVLQAQLWVDGALVLFQQGQTNPISARAKGLRLRAIKPPCVSFDNRGQRHHLCLSQAVQ
uniref:hypothetical protein n=2 Tax=Orrella sp. TaxID=1921583 RepID=UPI00404715BC